MKDVKKSKLPSTATGKKRSHDEVNETVSEKGSKRRKTANLKSATNPRDLYSNIRSSFIKWQRSQSEEIQNLKENTNFNITIELDELSGEYMTEIRCKCESNILLLTVNNKATISNWTRHIQKNYHALKQKLHPQKVARIFSKPLSLLQSYERGELKNRLVTRNKSKTKTS